MKLDYMEAAAGLVLVLVGLAMLAKRKYDVGDPDDETRVKFTVKCLDAVLYGAFLTCLGAYFLARSAGWF